METQGNHTFSVTKNYVWKHYFVHKSDSEKKIKFHQVYEKQRMMEDIVKAGGYFREITPNFQWILDIRGNWVNWP
jgi:hypothetical protein